MLTITLRDLGPHPEGGNAGVVVWWRPRPQRKRPLLMLAWPDLILFNPRVEWPDEVRPKVIEGWGEESVRLTYVKALVKLTTRTSVPTPATSPLESLERLDWSRVTLGEKHRVSHRVKLLEARSDGAVYYASLRAILRLTSALGEDSADSLDARLIVPPWAPQSPLLVVWKNRILRGATTLLTELPA